jgi:hypothetical protein
MGEYLAIRTGTAGPHLFMPTGERITAYDIGGFYDSKGNKVFGVDELALLARGGKFKGNPTLCEAGDVSLTDEHGNPTLFIVDPTRDYGISATEQFVTSVKVVNLPCAVESDLPREGIEWRQGVPDIGAHILMGGQYGHEVKRQIGDRLVLVDTRPGYLSRYRTGLQLEVVVTKIISWVGCEMKIEKVMVGTRGA